MLHQIAMRVQDEELACTFVKLRRDLHNIKLAMCAAEHQELLEDAMEAEQERGIEMHGPASTVSDVIPEALSPTLRNCGLTRMNITARRFSVF